MSRIARGNEPGELLFLQSRQVTSIEPPIDSAFLEV